MHDIMVVHGDITSLAVDAIVNAANAGMLGGGGVDGAIHRAAGPELLEACRAIPQTGGVRCPTGEARITPGFRLASRYVIHTVGPVWRGGDANEDALLEACYRSVMSIVRDRGLASVAFPAISTGVYAFPRERAAAIAVATVRDELSRARTSVTFACFDAETADVYRSILAGPATP
jgi:O-acetyl-ADP-ribose deacetylase (regulator of RNase III)